MTDRERLPRLLTAHDPALLDRAVHSPFLS
jgi:hypothetical protein